MPTKRPRSLSRRTLLTLPLLAMAARAQQPAWPHKPIRIVTPAPAGLAPDVLARMYADALARALGVPVVVDNRPGASMIIATDHVAKSAPDGCTLLYGFNSPFTMNPALFSRLPYDAQRDFAPVGQTLTGAYFILASKDFSASTLVELAALARSRPDDIAYASYGHGSASHLGFELLQDAAQIKLRHVAYSKGALNDVVGGQVPLVIEPAATALQFMQAGRVKPIAFTGTARHPLAQQVPAMGETYPGIELLGWHGVWAPAGTPPAIVERLNAELNRITQMEPMQRRVVQLGFEPVTGSSEQLAAIVVRESTAWARLIRTKGIRLD